MPSNLDVEMTDSNIIRQLITEENDAIISYRERANAVENPKAKAVLLDIANEEVTHSGELQELLSEMDGTNDKLVADGQKEVEDMKEEEIEKAYQDFKKADQQPNQTSVEDKLDVLLAQNQEIKVDTERTADAISEQTAGDVAENDMIEDDFAGQKTDLELGAESDDDLELSDDFGESEDTPEDEVNDTSDIEEVPGEESDGESDENAETVESDDESDVIEDETDGETDGESEQEESDIEEPSDEESDVIDDESEEPDQKENEDKKDEELDKALKEISKLKRENAILKAKLRRPISKSNEVSKPIVKTVKPMGKAFVKKSSRPPIDFTFGQSPVRPPNPTFDSLAKSDDDIKVGIGIDYKKAMKSEWQNYYQMKGL